jgi:hypothetical protein
MVSNDCTGEVVAILKRLHCEVFKVIGYNWYNYSPYIRNGFYKGVVGNAGTHTHAYKYIGIVVPVVACS